MLGAVYPRMLGAGLRHNRPTVAHVQLLRAALWGGERGREAWDWCSRSLIFHELDPGASRIIPLLEPRFKEYQASGSLVQQCRGLRKNAWVKNQVLLRQLRAHFSDWNEPPLVLKGAALLLGYYPDLSSRSMEDIDLWMPADAALSLSQRWQTQGWTLSPRKYCRHAQDYSVWHAFPMSGPGGIEVDLHGHILQDRCLDELDREFTRTALTLTSHPARVLAPPEQLLHTLVHGARFGDDVSVIWMADAFTILSREPNFDWSRLLELCQKFGLNHCCYQTLRALKEVLEVDIPADVLELLRTRSSALEKLEFRLRTQPGGGLANFQLYSVRYLILCRLQSKLPGPVGWLDYLRRLLGSPRWSRVPGDLWQLIRPTGP